jgi:hypothetical protein
MKKILTGLVLSSFAVVSCNSMVNVTTGNVLSEKVKPVTFDLGKGMKGSSFSVNIKFNRNNFSVKDNTNGTLPKTAADVNKYLVYLVKNTSTTGYPTTGSDPLGSTDYVAGPFEVLNSGAASKLFTFNNVASAGSSAYYAAVRAQDSAGDDIIKANTNWGSSTTAVTNRLAVSSGEGIVVDSDLQVSSTTALSVSPQLEDGTGAGIETVITPNKGSAILPSTTGS